VRGYPAEDHDEAMDALSVDYAPTLARYREARATSERAGSGTATTDDLRQAMLQYRELFYELVDVPADERVGGTTAARDAEVAQATKRTEPADEVPADGLPVTEASAEPTATTPSDAVASEATSPQRSTRG
jgi:hypothetical protein